MLAATDIRIDRLALLLGLAAAALLVLSWRVDGGTQPPPAEVTLITRSTAELAVTPDGVTSESGELRANDTGAELARELGVRNATGGPLEVVVRANSSVPDLDDALVLSVQMGGALVFEGPLAALKQGSAPVSLEAHDERALVVRSWIASDAPAGDWRARSVDVELDLVARPAR